MFPVNAFRGHGVIRLDDVTKDPRYERSPPYFGVPSRHLRVRSYLAVPITWGRGSVIGGLFFGHSAEGVFTEQHGRLVFQDGRELLDLPLPRLAGTHQIGNAGTAIAMARLI